MDHEFFDLVTGHIQGRDLPLQAVVQEAHEVNAALGREGEGGGALDLVFHAVEGERHLVQQLCEAPPSLVVHVVHCAVFHAPTLQLGDADGVCRGEPPAQLVHLFVPSSGVALGPRGPEGVGRSLGVGEVHVQDAHGVVVKREQFGVRLIVGLDLHVVHFGVKPALHVPGFVGVDEKAPAVGFQGSVQVGAFFLQLGVGLGEHDVLSHPTVNQTLRKGRAVFQPQSIRNPLGEAVPREHFAVGFRHHVLSEAGSCEGGLATSCAQR